MKHAFGITAAAKYNTSVSIDPHFMLFSCIRELLL